MNMGTNFGPYGQIVAFIPQPWLGTERRYTAPAGNWAREAESQWDCSLCMKGDEQFAAFVWMEQVAHLLMSLDPGLQASVCMEVRPQPFSVP